MAEYLSRDHYNPSHPKEGAKAVALDIPFTVSKLDFDLASYFTTTGAYLSQIQMLYIDNADGPEAVRITITVLDMTLVIPKFSQGYYVLPWPRGADFHFESSGATTARVSLINMPLPMLNWKPAGGGPPPDRDPRIISAGNFRTTTAGDFRVID